MPDGHTPIVEEKPSIYAALARAQAKMGAAHKDANNTHFSAKYATLASIRDAVFPPLTEEGICVIQSPYNTKEGDVGLITKLVYAPTGETVECDLSLSIAQTKNAAHDMGKAITYMRRFSLLSMAGVAPDDDDDGNSLSAAKPAAKKKSAAQAKRDGDFEKFQEKAAKKGEAEGPDGIRAWVESDAMQSWFDQFSKAFADGMRDEAEAQAKALEAKQNKSGRRRQPTDQPYAEQSDSQKVVSEFEEFCATCTAPSEILTEAAAAKASTDVIQEQDAVDNIADQRIEQLEKEMA